MIEKNNSQNYYQMHLNLGIFYLKAETLGGLQAVSIIYSLIPRNCKINKNFLGKFNKRLKSSNKDKKNKETYVNS
jgi:hypothetical protein